MLLALRPVAVIPIISADPSIDHSVKLHKCIYKSQRPLDALACASSGRAGAGERPGARGQPDEWRPPGQCLKVNCRSGSNSTNDWPRRRRPGQSLADLLPRLDEPGESLVSTATRVLALRFPTSPRARAGGGPLPAISRPARAAGDALRIGRPRASGGGRGHNRPVPWSDAAMAR